MSQVFEESASVMIFHLFSSLRKLNTVHPLMVADLILMNCKFRNLIKETLMPMNWLHLFLKVCQTFNHNPFEYSDSKIFPDVLGGVAKSHEDERRKKKKDFKDNLEQHFKESLTVADFVTDDDEEEELMSDFEEEVQTSQQVRKDGKERSPGQDDAKEEVAEEPKSDSRGKENLSEQVLKEKSPEQDLEGEDEDDGGEEITPFVGMQFDKREEVYKMMKKYSAQSKTAFFERSGRKDGLYQLIFECVHGKKRKSNSRGARAVTHSKKLGCEARICFYTRVSRGGRPGVTTLTGLNLKHEGHPTSDGIFQLDTAKVDTEAATIIKDLSDVGCSVPHIRSALRSKNHLLSAGQIRYHLSKLKDICPKDEEELKCFLRNVRATGGSVNILKNKRGNIQAVQVTTAAMKKAYNGCRPDSIQVDTTFNLESSKYKVNAVLFPGVSICHFAAATAATKN